MSDPSMERWHNPTARNVLVRAAPDFWVKPGGSFDFDARFHNAIHDLAPHLVCAQGAACAKAEDQSLHALMHRTQEAS